MKTLNSIFIVFIFIIIFCGCSENFLMNSPATHQAQKPFEIKPEYGNEIEGHGVSP